MAQQATTKSARNSEKMANYRLTLGPLRAEECSAELSRGATMVCASKKLIKEPGIQPLQPCVPRGKREVLHPAQEPRRVFSGLNSKARCRIYSQTLCTCNRRLARNNGPARKFAEVLDECVAPTVKRQSHHKGIALLGTCSRYLHGATAAIGNVPNALFQRRLFGNG